MTVWSKQLSSTESAVDRLRALLSALSEDLICSRWSQRHIDALYDLARGLDTTLLDNGRVCREDAEALTALANECGGWFVWSKDDMAPRFVLEAEYKRP